MSEPEKVQAARDRAALIAAQDADAPKLTQRLDAEALRVLVDAYDALRLSLAQAQATVARFREACLRRCAAGIEKCELCGRSNIDHSAEGRRFATVQHSADCPCNLATPADDGALREMLGAAWDAGYDVGREDMARLTPGGIEKERAADVARVLGGAS